MARTDPRPSMRRGAYVDCPECRKRHWCPPSKLARGNCCSIACRDAHARRTRYNDAAQLKRCVHCEQWKPFGEFGVSRGKRSARRNPLQAYCNGCAHEINRQWRAIHRPAKAKATLTEAQRLQRKLMHNKRRAHMHRAAGVMPSPSELERLCCEQDWRCVYCGHLLVERHLDHIVPVTKGGTNAIDNLQWLCPACNMRKGVLSDAEFAGRVGRMGRTSSVAAEFDVGEFCGAMERGDYRGALEVVGKTGIHGDRSAWRLRKLTELDALADTIRRLEVP